MTNIRIDKIQIKRGTVANLPILDDGELFYAYDTKEHYLGMGGLNQLISKDFASLNQHYEGVLSRFGINSSGKLTIDSVEFAGGGAGSLVYNTLSDLQTAYPGGTTQPVWVIGDNAWYYWSGAVVGDTTAPVITASSSGGTFTSAQSVTLSANETSTIYYTLDGSTPTTSSTVYSSAISIGSTSTLKFFGKDAAGNSSAVQSISFTINAPDTTAPTVNISPAAGTFASAQSVTLTANEPSTIYYTTDGSTPTTSSAVYSTPISISANTTLKYFAKDTAGNSSAVQTAAFTIDTVAPVVTASPAAGTYTSAQSVTLSTEAGATIYYTTNGTTPTTSSTVYSGPITISATTTLQFIGKDAVGNLSVPVAATYTINAVTNAVSDSFNRADSTTSLGVADTGQSWNALTGTWGISSNRAYLAAGTGGIVVVDSGKSDTTVQVTNAIITTTNMRFVFRLTDTNNYYIVQTDTGNVYKLYKNVAGTFTSLGTTTGVTPANGDVLKVVLNGSSITVYVNDVQKITATDTFNQTATKHGFAHNAVNPASRWDDFSVL